MLSNCKECGHAIDSEALACPHCGAPKKMGNTKNCIHCNTEIDSRKKKCPSCGELQTSIQRKSSMATPQKNYTALYVIIAFIAGCVGMYFFMLSQQPAPIPPVAVIIPSNEARVNFVQGLPVFINSEPEKKYSALGNAITLDAINAMVDAENGKKKVVDQVVTAFGQVRQDLDFNQKLEKMVSKARSEHPDADAIIFRDKMNSCQAIKFNNPQ